MTAQVKKLMDTLNLTEQEALELIAEDKRIDQGKKLEKLDPELEVGAKKARRADRKKPVNVKRERKVNTEKKELLDLIAEPLRNAGATVLEVKTETEMLFEYKGVSYSFRLIGHNYNKAANK